MQTQQTIIKLSKVIFCDIVEKNALNLLEKISNKMCSKGFMDLQMNKIYERVANLITDIVISEFQEYKGRFNEMDYINKQMETMKSNYFEYISQPMEIQRIRKKYPVLKPIIEKEISNIINHYNIILNEYNEIQSDLKSVFEISGKILDIEFNIGDVHEGQSVSKVIFEDGVLYYKPRKLELEKLIDKFILKVKHKSSSFGTSVEKLRIPKSYESLYNTWQEQITFSFNEEEDDVISFFYNAGIYLGIFYLLGVSDLHFENVINTNGTPVFIDLEAITSPSLTDESIELTKKLFNRSVLATALLPVFNESLGLNMSGLFSSAQETSQLTFEVLTDDEQYGWVYESKNGYMDPKENIIKLKDEIVNPLEFVAMLKTGFKDLLNDVVNDTQGYINILESTNVTKIKSRILLRHTAIYTKFIEASRTPEYLSSFEKQNEIFNILKQNYQPDKFGYNRVQEEIENLKNGDIPLFYTFLPSKDLFINGKKIINGYFKKTIYDEILMKIKYLDEEMINYQIHMIDLSMTTLLKSTDFDTLTNKHLLEYSENNNEILLQNNIENLLEKHKIALFPTGDGLLDYYRIELFSLENIKIDLSKFGLYDSTGLLLFMYEFGDKYKKINYIENSQQIYKNLYNKFTALSGSHEDILKYDMSVYFGLGGILYTSYYLYKKTTNIEYLEDFKKIYKQFIPAVKSQILSKTIQLDFVSGLSGIVSLLSKIYLEDKEKTVQIIDLEILVDALLENDLSISEGLAHGSLGISRALLDFEKVADLSPMMKTMIEKSLVDFPEKTKKYTWCNGYAGYLDVLTDYYILLDKESKTAKKVKVEIKKQLLDIDKLFSSSSLSLCHGVFGVVDILLSKLRDQKDVFKFVTNREEILDRIHSMNVSDLTKVRWTTKTSIICDSFMTGAPGIAYELMRIQNPRLKSIMNFNL